MKCVINKNGYVMLSNWSSLNITGRNAQQIELIKFSMNNKRERKGQGKNIKQANNICKTKQQQ